MKKAIVILIAMVLVCGVVACSPFEGGIPQWFDSIEVYSAESTNTTEVAGNIMAVFYRKADERVLKWFVNVQIIDRGDGKWDVVGSQGSVRGINQETVAYGLYQYKPLPDPQTNTLYLDDLGLQAITANDLPKSQHIGKLTAVNPALAKPATVTRKYMGQIYNAQCLVDQVVVDMWLAGTLQVGDYVRVQFIKEIPNTEEIDIAIVVGKVFESW